MADRMYLPENVLEAAQARIRYLFKEFPVIVAGVSGGKDSSVVFELCLAEAKRQSRPLHVLFIDQEVEWSATIDVIEATMQTEGVVPHWLQVPFNLFNSTAFDKDWFRCWDEKQEANWIRPKHPLSVKENIFGTDRYKDLYYHFMDTTFPDQRVALIGGVRTEESPARYIGLTQGLTYKWIAWGRGSTLHRRRDQHFTFYPIYDWSYTDVWKFIHDNKVQYNDVYNQQYRLGMTPRQMRVSSLVHETAIQNLEYVQEYDKELWDRILVRAESANAIKTMKKHMVHMPDDLPYMFGIGPEGWREYRDHLLKHLIAEKNREKFVKRFERMELTYGPMNHKDELYRAQIGCMLANDHFMTKLDNWENRGELNSYRKWKRGVKNPTNGRKNRYIPQTTTA